MTEHRSTSGAGIPLPAVSVRVIEGKSGEELPAEVAGRAAAAAEWIDRLLLDRAARRDYSKLLALRAAGGQVVLAGAGGYDHLALQMSLGQVAACVDRPMGSVFVVAMMLAGVVRESLVAARLAAGLAAAAATPATDTAPLRGTEVHAGARLSGAVIHHRPRCLSPPLAERMLQAFLPGGAAGVPWEQRQVNMWGSLRRERRLVACYSDAGLSYRYSGRDNPGREWGTDRSGLLQLLLDLLEWITGTRYNYCLMNLYRCGRDLIGRHADSQRGFAADSAIASFSLGAPRPLVFTANPLPGAQPPPAQFAQPPGCLLVMGGATQQRYKHEIRADRTVAAPRISLTFRVMRRATEGQ